MAKKMKSLAERGWDKLKTGFHGAPRTKKMEPAGVRRTPKGGHTPQSVAQQKLERKEHPKAGQGNTGSGKEPYKPKNTGPAYKKTTAATKGAKLKPSLKSGTTAGTKVGTGVTTTTVAKRNAAAKKAADKKAVAKKTAPKKAAPKKSSAKKGSDLKAWAAKERAGIAKQRARAAGKKVAAKQMKKKPTAKKRRMSSVDRAKGHFA